MVGFLVEEMYAEALLGVAYAMLWFEPVFLKGELPRQGKHAANDLPRVVCFSRHYP
jgi:hypothetical protein